MSNGIPPPDATRQGMTWTFDINVDRMGRDHAEAMRKAYRMSVRTGNRYVVRRKRAGWGANRWWAAQAIR